jgi:hypothetical protein
MGRPVRLCDDRDDVMVLQDGLERGEGERGRSVEENLQALGHDDPKLPEST